MIKGINHITLATADLDKSFLFYSEVLGCVPMARWKHGAYLLAGDLWLCLSLDKNTRNVPAGDYSHIALHVEPADFDQLAKKVLLAGQKLWKENTSEGASLYFLDPDNHKIELHCTTWQDRLKSTKENPYEAMEFYI